MASAFGGARLLAVVLLRPNEIGRHYRLPTDGDYAAVWQAMQRLERVAAQPLPNGLSPVPDEPTPAGGGSGAGRAFSVQNYGMMKFGDMFAARQKLAMVTFRKIIAGTNSQSQVAHEIAGLALSRFSDISNAFCRWESSKTQVRNLFTRQALPMLWDFAEASIFGEQAGDYTVTLETMTQVIKSLPQGNNGQTQIADACESPLPDGTTSVWFTDPLITTQCRMLTFLTFSLSGSSVYCLTVHYCTIRLMLKIC
jgi:adenine-specific DNA methylase